MSDRERDVTEFSYPSYRAFKKILGEYDAVIECIELAIQEFQNIYSKVPIHKKSDFIAKMSETHSVDVSVYDFRRIDSRTSKLSIVSTHREFEIFLDDFKQEFKHLNDVNWISKKDGQTSVDNCIQNIQLHVDKAFIDKELVDAYNYYRLVRNHIAHGNLKDNRMKKLYGDLAKVRNQLLDRFNLSDGLNEIENFDHSDFILFTNLVKHIAFELSFNAKPGIDRIANYICLDKKNIYTLKKILNNTERFDKALRNIYVTAFGRISSTEYSVLNSKIRGLLA